MAGGSFISILRLVGFLSALWSVGKVSKAIGVSSIVFEIAIGLILSPSMVGLLPASYSECSAKNQYSCESAYVHDSLYRMKDSHGRRLAGGSASCDVENYMFANNTLDEVSFTACEVKLCKQKVTHMCQVEPNTFTLIGHTGVSMMIFESGMHFDFEKAKVVGPKACIVAIFGTLLPLVAGMLIIWWFGYPLYPDGVSAGVSLAPTSVGIALKLLLEAKQLQKDFGQAIITAAFVDDILSLVAFNVLFSVSSGSFSFTKSILPALGGIVFLIAGASLGIKFWPWVVEELLSRLPPKKGVGSLTRQDESLLFLMMGLLMAYATFTWWLGTHLWGCFVAGMSFAMIHHAHHVWVKQVKRITVWMLRIFFGATVAFAIPLESLLSAKAFGIGSVLGIFACILTKVVSGVFMGDSRFVIGWAMVGRAEFAYLIAELAKGAGMMSSEVFSIVIWSLLYATIFAPFCFRKVLQRYAARLHEKEKQELEMKTGGADMGSLALPHDDHSGHQANLSYGEHKAHSTMDGHKWVPGDLTAFRFTIFHPKIAGTAASCNVENLSEIWGLLREQGLAVTQMSQQCDTDTHYSTFQVQSEDGSWIEKSELEFVQEQIFRELKGLGAHVIFLPAIHALQDKCKLAKVTVVADLTGDDPLAKPSIDGISKIVDATIQESFYIMRCGLEMHGNSAVFRFLLGHPMALELCDNESTAPDSAATGKTTRSWRQNLVNGDGIENESGLTSADLHADHLHLGTSGLPDILPSELNSLKARIEGCLENRICTIVEPLTYSQGPFGEDSHDARTLLMAQGNTPACEFRLVVDRVYKDLFSNVLRVLSQPGISLVSARVDERSACQIQCVISTSELSTELQNKILNELETMCTTLGPINGHIDVSNINTPLQKLCRNIGVAK